MISPLLRHMQVPGGHRHILAIVEEGPQTPSHPNLEPQEVQCPPPIFGHPISVEESNQFPESQRLRDKARKREMLLQQRNSSTVKISQRGKIKHHLAPGWMDTSPVTQVAHYGIR